MTHLLQWSSQASTASDSLLPAPPEESARAAFCLDQRVIGQTILKLAESPPRLQESLAIGSFPGTVLKPLHGLVTAVAQLPPEAVSEKPIASETLPPTVLAEAQAVLDALQAIQREKQDPGKTQEPTNPGWEIAAGRRLVWPTSPWQNYIWLQTLAPWLLWGIARSAHAVMRCLEGVPATVAGLQHGQTGMLRLVALLDVNIPESSCCIDLATYQAPPALLPPNSVIQLPDSPLAPQPIAVAELVQRLTQQVQTITPSLHPFFQGLPAEILAPGQAWQSSLIQLRLGVEFIPDGEASLPQDQWAPAIAERSSPRVRFSKVAWLDQYSLTITQQQVATLVPHLASAEWATSAAASEPDRLGQLIREARIAADGLQTSFALASRNCLQQELSLEELMQSLLWSLSHSAYEVMQVMSGIRVHLLQPQQGWISGSLRFLVRLNLQLAETCWHLDIMTRQPVQPTLISPAPDAIVRSDDCRWCHQPNLLANLETAIWQQIHAATPEIRLLLAGAEINLQDSESQQADGWQAGRLQLSTAFAFIPDVERL